MNHKINRIVIVGGGSAGWSTAAGLARVLGTEQSSITLIESDAIGIIGVGEASIPPMQAFHKTLGLNEADFVRKTQATFKLGIEFQGWGTANSRYFHPFGDYGRELDSVSFHQYWLRAQSLGMGADLAEFSLCTLAAAMGKFAPGNSDPNSILSNMGYAYHFDAGLYAKMLREYSENLGVNRHEGKITEVANRGSDGFISHVVMESGEKIEGDLFIDCSGFASLLIGKNLGVKFDDWTHLLPANRAVAVAAENRGPTAPYTMSMAHAGGWQWRIPLQHRCGNGLVYSNEFLSDDEASQTLLNNLAGPAIADPRVIKFTTGRRAESWHKNCIAIGLAAGFMEPLESTAIHLVQASISRLLQLFPGQEFNQADINEFNQQTEREYQYIRDFIILHYHANKRPEPLWQYCQNMQIPDSLTHKIELFSNRARIFEREEDLFKKASWVAVLLGQGIHPQNYDAVADRKSPERLRKIMQEMRMMLRQGAEAMPSHDEFIEQQCKAPALDTVV